MLPTNTHTSIFWYIIMQWLDVLTSAVLNDKCTPRRLTWSWDRVVQILDTCALFHADLNLFARNAKKIEVLTKGFVSKLCYLKNILVLSHAWVFFLEEFNSYVKSTLKGLKCWQEVAYSMLYYSETNVTLSCVWAFFPDESKSYVKSTLKGLKCWREIA